MVTQGEVYSDLLAFQLLAYFKKKRFPHIVVQNATQS